MKKIITITLSIIMFNLSVFANSFEDAEKYIEVGNNSSALETLRSIEPKNIDEIARQSFLIGKIYFALGKINRSEEFFLDASMKNPGESKYEVGLAEAKIALGKFKEASQILERIVKDDSDIISAFVALATIEERLGKVEKAKLRFEELASRQPHSEIVHVAYAKFLDLRVSQVEAITVIEEYLKRYPKSPRALNLLGQIYSFIGYQSKAIEYKNKALKIFENQGQQIYAQAIIEWLNDHAKIKKIDTTVEIDTNKNKNLELQKPTIKYQTSSNLDQWPIKKGEHAYTGSGFITGNGDLIITNRHVIENARRVYVRNGLGEIKAAKIEKISKEDDIALLRIDEPYNDQYAQSIPESYNIKIGQKIYVIGYPLADLLGESKPSITQGIISKDTGMKDDPAQFQITAKLNSGNSGGPIISSEGNIVGIAVSKLDKTDMLVAEGKIPEDVNFGININRVEEFLDISTNKLFTEELQLENLYEAMLPSIVMVLSIVDAPN